MTSLSDSSRPVRRYVTSAMSSQSQVISAKAEVHSNNYQIPSSEPWIEIIEQPISNALRFRYQCEGRSAGSLLGQSSTNDQKVFPTIAIRNANCRAAIVVVSCVTKDAPHRPHPHNLVGQDCKDGVCTVKVISSNAGHIVPFPNIGIQCCKRNEVEGSLKAREKLNVDPFNCAGYKKVEAAVPASTQNGTGKNGTERDVDLTTVRLCFQAFLPDASKKFTRVVAPVVSEPIIDKKTIKDLKICRISQTSSSVLGKEEIIILCEKVTKDDIEVRFYEEDAGGGVSWLSYGEFENNYIHKQCAIVFRTPEYHTITIDQPITVFIQLRRPSDEQSGPPQTFTYRPANNDLDTNTSILRPAIKRKQTAIPAAPVVKFTPLPTCIEQTNNDDDSGINSTITNVINKRIKLKGGGEQSPKQGAVLNRTSASYTSEKILPTYSNYFEQIKQEEILRSTSLSDDNKSLIDANAILRRPFNQTLKQPNSYHLTKIGTDGGTDVILLQTIN